MQGVMRDSYEVHPKQTCLSHGHSCVVAEGQNDQCLKDKMYESSCLVPALPSFLAEKKNCCFALNKTGHLH